PRLLLPAAAFVDGQLRALAVARRPRCGRPRGDAVARGARPLRTAGARPRPARGPRGLRRPAPSRAGRLSAITAIRAYRHWQPFAEGSYGTSGGSAEGFDAVVVAVDTASGVTGWGEMAPLSSFYSDAFAAGARA